MTKRKKTDAHLIAGILLSIILLTSLYQMHENKKSFSITEVVHAKNPAPDWFRKDAGERAFVKIVLPYFADDGYFRVYFTTNKEILKLRVLADDCLEEAYLDGEKIHEHTGGCLYDPRGIDVYLNPAVEKTGHTLALKIRNSRGKNLFYVEYEQNAMKYKMLAVISAALLILLNYFRLKHKLRKKEKGVFARVYERRNFWILILVSVIIRLIIMPATMSPDISGAATIYTENFVHKTDFSFTKLDEEYMYRPGNYMNKPPGWAIYPLAILRMIFGFSSAYLSYLVKFPALFGDLLIAYVIYSFLKDKLGDETTALLATSLYLFNPGVLTISARLGKTDSMTVGLLMLALKNIERKRFSAYYGLSVVTKQFPLFMLPWLLLQKKLVRKTLIAGLITLLLLSPYLLDNAGLFIQRMTERHVNMNARGLSWMTNLAGWGVVNSSEVGLRIFRAYPFVLIALALTVNAGAFTSSALVLGLFQLFNKNGLEQYFLWTIPFFLIVYFTTKKNSALIAFLVTSVSCTIFYDAGHRLLYGAAANQWNLLQAIVILGFCLDIIASHYKPPKKKAIRDAIGSRERKLVAFLFVVGFVYFVSSAYITSSNDGSHFALVSAMVEKRSVDIRDYLGYTDKMDYAVKDGGFYSDRTPGTAFLATPFYVFGKIIRDNGLGVMLSNHRNIPEIFVIFLPNIMGVLTIFILYRLLVFFGFGFRVSMLVLGAYAFGTLGWLESTHLFSHAQSIFFTLLAVYLAVTLSKFDRKHTKHIMGLSAALAVSSIIEIQNIIFVPIFAVYLFTSKKIKFNEISKKRVLSPLIAGAIVFFIIYSTLIAYNYLAFGEITIKSNAYNPRFKYEKSFMASLSGNPVIGLDRLFTNFSNKEVILGWSRGVRNSTPGLFVVSPILLLSVVGFYYFFRKNRGEALLFSLLILAEVAVVSFHVNVFTRHAITILPLLFLPIAYVIEKTLKLEGGKKYYFLAFILLLSIFSAARVFYVMNRYYGHTPENPFKFMVEIPSFILFYGFLALAYHGRNRIKKI